MDRRTIPVRVVDPGTVTRHAVDAQAPPSNRVQPALDASWLGDLDLNNVVNLNDLDSSDLDLDDHDSDSTQSSR